MIINLNKIILILSLIDYIKHRLNKNKVTIHMTNFKNWVTSKYKIIMNNYWNILNNQ